MFEVGKPVVKTRARGAPVYRILDIDGAAARLEAVEPVDGDYPHWWAIRALFAVED